jgi:hypothetical protein
MASDLRADAHQLDIAGQYDPNLTLHMLDSFMEAGGNNNEDFRYPLRALKVKLGDALLAIGYMSREDSRKHMASLKLNYKDICTTAVDQYRSQFDNQRWPPSRGVSDTRIPPSAFGNVSHCSPDAVAIAQAYALIQQQQGPSSKGKDGNCLHCGKPGHWARDCPSKRSNGKGKPTSSGNRTRSSGPRSTPDPPTWKRIAPKPSEPSTKTSEGKTWRWCGKCARLSTTHGTDQHTGPVKASKASSSNTPPSVQANTIFPMPSAWNVPFLLDPTISDVSPFGVDFLKLLAVIFHRTLFLTFFAAGFAYTLGSTPATFWGYCLHMFTDHWTHFLPLLFWLLCVLISIFGPTLLQCLRPPPAAPNLRPLSPAHRKRMFRRQRRRHVPPRVFRPGSFGLRRKAGSRPPMAQRDMNLVFDAIEGLKAFSHAITFRRVRREGAKIRRRPQRRDQINSYRPPSSRLTQSQLEQLVSPAFKAYFLNAPLPERILSATQALRAALMAPQETHEHVKKEHRFPIIWDSGASISISSHLSDFVGPLSSTPTGIRLQGIAKGLSIHGVGHVAWSFVDNKGMLRTLKLPVYHVPRATARLLSTTSLLQQHPSETIQQFSDRLILSGNKKLGTSGIEILTDPRTNLHVGVAYDNTAPSSIHAAFFSRELWHTRIRLVASRLRLQSSTHSRCVHPASTANSDVSQLPGRPLISSGNVKEF